MLPAATPALTARYEQFPPHVSPAIAARSPRVVTLRVQPVGAGRAIAVGVVDDGQLTYRVAFTLQRRRRWWLVTRLVAN